MFRNYNLEDFFIFIKLNPYLTRSLLIIYIKMFNPLKSEIFTLPFEVDNQLQNVDSTLFLRIKSIDIYCYK